MKKFGILIEDVHSVTSDSGANIVKSIRLMDESYRQVKFGIVPEENATNNDFMNTMIESIVDEHELFECECDHIIGKKKK